VKDNTFDRRINGSASSIDVKDKQEAGTSKSPKAESNDVKDMRIIDVDPILKSGGN
jgi:hypothetical protein